MARRIEYTGQPVLTLEQVMDQCREDADSIQTDLVTGVIIPGVTAQAEAKTGAAIREAVYEEIWPESRLSGAALDVGQAFELVSIQRGEEDLTSQGQLEQGSRETRLHFPAGRPAGALVIRYKAGVDLAAYPSVLSWLLLQAATAYGYREAMITGTILTELPSGYLDSLLSDITLPPRF